MDMVEELVIGRDKFTLTKTPKSFRVESRFMYLGTFRSRERAIKEAQLESRRLEFFRSRAKSSQTTYASAMHNHVESERIWKQTEPSIRKELGIN